MIGSDSSATGGGSTSATTGSSSTAGSTGSSSSGATVDAGQGTSADGGIGGAAATISDNFESGSLSSSIWSLTDMNGVPNTQYTPVTTVAISSTHAHSGMYSVEINGGGFFGTAPPAAAFYGRAWVYFGSSPGSGHWAFIEGVGPGSQSTATQVRLGGNLGTYDANIQTSAFEDEIRANAPDGGAIPVPLATWTCFEFYYGENALALWQNGVQILAITPTTPWLDGNAKTPWSPQYVMIRFGYATFSGVSIDVWIDDVALDAQRVGCN
jgi:hypothetical protein